MTSVVRGPALCEIAGPSVGDLYMRLHTGADRALEGTRPCDGSRTASRRLRIRDHADSKHRGLTAWPRRWLRCRANRLEAVKSYRGELDRCRRIIARRNGEQARVYGHLPCQTGAG